MTQLLAQLSRTAFRKGVLGGSRQWIVVWAAAALLTRARRKSEEEAVVIHREVLGPGETVRVSVIDPGPGQ